MLRLLFSRRWWWTTLIVVAGIGLAIRLGIWQLDRHHARQESVRHIQLMQALPVLNLNTDSIPPDLKTMEYRQVTASGQYDFNHQFVLRNQARERMSGTDPGYALVTPLLLDDGQVVLVNRGWIPLDDSTPDSWRQFNQPGEVNIEGVLRASMQKGELGGGIIDPTLAPGQASLNYWNFMNLDRIQEQLPYPILGMYIEQGQGNDPEAIPSPLAEAPDLDPGEHIGFALQWFFYAGLLFVGYQMWLRKQESKTTRLGSTG
jgi:surfeit locus 1 family protein